MSRAHGLDRKSRQATTKAASRASISARRRSSALPLPLLRVDKEQAKPQAVGLLLLLRPKPHQELAFYPFCAAFFRRPIGGAVGVTRWNPLCDRKEKGKAQRENKKQ